MTFLSAISYSFSIFLQLPTPSHLIFLVLRNSSLQKPPFITAHCRASLRIVVHHCTLKQALLHTFILVLNF